MARRKPNRKRSKPAAVGGRRRRGTAAPDALLGEAVQAFRSGDLGKSRGLCQELLAATPDHPIGLHLMGVICRHAGQLAEACEYLRRAVSEAPDYGEAYNDLGAAFFDLGQFDAAGEVQEKAAQLAPGEIGPLMNLGNTRRAQGRFDEALECYRAALAREPRMAGAHVNIGVVLREQGHAGEAAESQRRAIDLDPALIPAHVNLGKALRDLGDDAGAAASYRRALSINPDARDALTGLAGTAIAAGRPSEAAEHLSRVAEATPDLAAAWSEVGAAFFRAHDTASAAEAFQTAVDLDPENAEAWFNLGNVRESSGRSEDAIECYRRATDIRPAFVKAHNNLGFVLNGLDRLDDAVLSYEAALREDPNNTDALTNMGNAWREQGNLDAALEHYEKALETDPACANAHGNILLTEHARPGATPAGILARHLEWDARHGAPLQQSWPDHGNRADPDRRLKVGLVSADFGRHPVGYFTIGFFENHDPTELELTGYCGRSPDPMTERFIKAAGHWVDIRGMTDADLAERVRADGIDILFDLSGHTTNHRLACFARKPAPVQISWSGYPGTTGLRAMDYLVSDSVHTAAGDDDAHAERLIRMPASFISYTAPDGVPDVGPLPRLENGLVTFGCFSNPAKINADLLARWARIMRRLPDSRLVMTYQHLDAAENRRRIQETLAGHGIDASRVEIGGRRDPMELISGYNGIDIAFDTHPYSGGATTCEAIWMGVPVLTLPGSTFASRHAASLLSAAGLDDWIASDEDDLVERTVALAADPERLAEIRAGLRGKVAASALCDAAAFSRDLGGAVRDAWRAWCER